MTLNFLSFGKQKANFSPKLYFSYFLILGFRERESHEILVVERENHR
jgi:hypothetical protein